MTSALILFLLFFLLFFISRTLTRSISGLILEVTKRQKIAVYFLAFLFLPGTLIHEVAHYLMANLLFVPAGNMRLWPKIDGNHVRLGSVEIQTTDPFRRMLIGFAPFLFGSTILFTLIYYISIQDFPLFSMPLFGLGYAIFEIGNTMFSSRKDLEGVIEVVGAITILSILLYIAGIRLPDNFFYFLSSEKMETIFQMGSTYILIPIVLDVLIILFFNIAKRALTK